MTLVPGYLTGCEIRESNSGPLAPRLRTNRLCHSRSSLLLRSDEGLRLQTSAFQIVHSGTYNSIFINTFVKTKFSCFTLPPTQHHSFFHHHHHHHLALFPPREIGPCVLSLSKLLGLSHNYRLLSTLRAESLSIFLDKSGRGK